MNVKIDGSNLAALICSHQLVQAGHDVTVKIPKGVKFGGHFAGVELQDLIIDLGMVLLEPRMSPEAKTIHSYNSETGQASNSYNHAVFTWLESQGISLEKVSVFSKFNEDIYNDFLIADSLDLVAELNLESGGDYSQYCKQIDELPDLCPSKKAESSFFELPISVVFPVLYGPVISSFLLAIAVKIAGPDAVRLATRYHRMLWLPLYYPKTIAEYESALTQLEFYSPVNGGVSGLCKQLLDQLEESPKFKTVEKFDELDEVRTGFTNNRPQQLYFIDEKRLRDFDSEVLTSLIGFAIFVDTSAQEKKVVHNLSDSGRWFRYSQSLSRQGIVIVEIGFIKDEICDSDISQWAKEAIKAEGIVWYSEPLILRSRINYPIEISPSVHKIESEAHVYRTYLDSRSFNNQVALGIKAATEFLELESNHG